MHRLNFRNVVLLTSLASAPGALAQRGWDFETRTERFRITSAAMEPTVRQGTSVMARIGATHPEPPRRGEIILFRHNYEVGISRVIGLPGDTVAVAGGIVTVNGTALPRRSVAVPQGYTRRGSRPNCFEETLDGRDYAVCETPGRTPTPRDTQAGVVPAGTVLVMGDNRDNGVANRIPRLGLVSLAEIYGRDLTADGSFTPLR